MKTRLVFVESFRAGNGRVCAVRASENAEGTIGHISERSYQNAMREVGCVAGNDTLRIASVGNPPPDGYEIAVDDNAALIR